MPIERHLDPTSFLTAAAPTLASAPAFAALLAVLVPNIESHPVPGRCLMATWAGDGSHGVAFQRNEGPLVLGGQLGVAAAELARWVADEVPDLNGFTGSLGTCEAFAAAWRHVATSVAKQRTHMRNHVLSRLISPPSASGTMRVADAGDGDWLLAMLRAFANEAGMPLNEPTLQRQMMTRLEAGGYRIWEIGDVPTAFAGFTLAGATAARIAPVYTLPAFRGRGCASALVAAMCIDLLEQREAIFLVTDVSNPVSNAIYRRLGFEPLDDTYAYDLQDAG